MEFAGSGKLSGSEELVRKMIKMHLSRVPREDGRHFMLCLVCKVYIGCRDLGEVFDHIHDPNLENASHPSGRAGVVIGQ
jgi:hypothetical protein